MTVANKDAAIRSAGATVALMAASSRNIVAPEARSLGHAAGLALLREQTAELAAAVDAESLHAPFCFG